MNLLLTAIYYSLYIIQMILFLRILLSWFRLAPDNPIVKILISLTEPLLGPIRIIVEKSIFGGRKGGMIIDISPLIAFIFLQMMQNYIFLFMK